MKRVISVFSALAVAGSLLLSCDLPADDPIQQEEEVVEETPVFSIDPKSVDVPAEGGEFDIRIVSTDVEYDITIVDNWIEELSRSGERKTGETIRFKASANPDETPRSGIVSVCTKDGSCIPVTVSQAAAKEPVLVHNNLGFRFTATWCGWCPYMDKAFHDVAEDEDVKFNFITFHISYGYPLYLADGGALANAFKVESIPTGILNGWQHLDNYQEISYTASLIKKAIVDFEKTFPCDVGIGVSSSISLNCVYAKATIEAPPGDYLVAAFLLESGIVEPQYHAANGYINNFVHDNVARKTLTNSPSGDAFTASEEPTVFNWDGVISSNCNINNLSVAVLVLRAYDSASQKAVSDYPDYYVVNSAIAPIGVSKKIEYE